MLINGTPARVIEAADRGLHYGDGLFETLAVVDGQPSLWKAHMNRLRSGCERMGIECPDESLLLRESLAEIDSEQRGILKIIVTRGAGERGYRPPVPSRKGYPYSAHQLQHPPPRLLNSHYLKELVHPNRRPTLQYREQVLTPSVNLLLLPG